ncbi:hypothetical protein ACA910_009429 [Epithemia clementina (nom. ined.)]
MKLQRFGLLCTLVVSLSTKNKAWARLLFNHNKVSRQLQPKLPGGCENFVTSGYDIEAPSSVQFYTASTFITLAQAGTYIGPSAVLEYIGFASANSPFFDEDDILLRVPQFVGFAPDPKTKDNTPLCQFTVGFLSLSKLQDPFAKDENVIFERATFVKIFWNPQTQKVDHIYVLFDDDFLLFFFNQLDTAASAGLVCSVYTQACATVVETVTVENCLAEFGKLPLVEQGSYIVGNSKGCRFLHSVFAGSGLTGAAISHCPHISFQPLADPKGFVKCHDTGVDLLAPTDLFTASDFEIWKMFKVTVFGFFGQRGESFLQVGDMEAGVSCPRGSRLEKNGQCKKLCKGGVKLDIDPTISDSIPVCVPNN